MGIQINYAAPGLSSGHAVLEVAHKFWNESETCSGEYAQLGFLYLYELLTGTKKVKLVDPDCSQSFAILVAELLSDKAEPAFLPSIISMMCRYPHIVGLMPKFKDTRKFKNTTMSASDPSDDAGNGTGLGPLGNLLSGCMQVLQAEIYNMMLVDTQTAQLNLFPVPSDDPVSVEVVSLSHLIESRKWVVPTISNYSCNVGTLRTIVCAESEVTMEIVDGDSPSKENIELIVPKYLELSESDIDAFMTLPLKVIGLDKFIRLISRSDVNRPEVAGTLPFDVSNHFLAKSAIAKSMINRLGVDILDYASAINNDLKPRLNLLDYLESRSPEISKGELESAVRVLETLVNELEALRCSDTSYVGKALPWLEEQVNSVTLTSATTTSKLLYLLRRFSGQEATIWLEFMFGTVLSSRQIEDLINLNPFLTSNSINILNAVVTSAVFHANRIGQINRCLLDARNIQKSMIKLLNNGRDESIIQDIVLKCENLVTNLNMGRHYIEEISVNSFERGGESKRRRTEESIRFVYDPRFMLFEFTWNILLRKVQVQMVRDYVGDLKNGKSSVKQMIMGAGKTTVICPLLTLILSDGESLVVQVVPPALLEFSRSVMRSTFSSIMHKRIFTLQFDRSTEVSANMFTKLLQSRATRGVVITTPTTVKSIMLKFLETMEIMRDNNEKCRNTTINRDCQVFSYCIGYN